MVKVIAEIGCNHLGDMNKAKKLIDAAHSAGADYAKFQMFVVDKINDPSIHDFLYRAYFTEKQHIELKNHCNSIGIKYLCSAFDVESLQVLKDMGCDTVKIPSGQIHNKAILHAAAQHDWHILASTGMCDLMSVTYAVSIFDNYSAHYTLFHCTSSYPCPPEDVNIKGIHNLKCYMAASDGFGFSDHSLSFVAAPMAIAHGATWVEHHLRLAGQHGSPDIPVSFSPIRMLHYIHCIREAETLLGDGSFDIRPSEEKMLHRRDFRTF